ncbi:phenylacetate-CoA oxygenase subunit PaaJ [Streptomyces lonarensis]|uniref:Phenylacetate-CoA oxygenase subunit PaaJ n=1 Tax=Streptomyces lonarensis TaxID=700599 RepID=A0A7X6CYU1_9ACTN|nr:phenylacetate-CoA oxygenase subunit PaaJ [Streptomyces lonarensis]
MPAEEVAARIGALPDPELPMITLADLGVLHSVGITDDGRLDVALLPTFLGCPGLESMAASARAVLAECGHPDGRVRQVLAPAWTTDRITEAGRAKLAAHGIAPPGPAGDGPVPVELTAACTHCGSAATRPHSPFGPSRCQAVQWCTSCRETFPAMTVI